MKIDYDVSVFIITEFNEYIEPYEYDKNEDGKGIFVCLTNEQLNPEYEFNNSICIYKDLQAKLEESKSLFPKKVHFKKEDGYIISDWQKNYDNISNNEKYRFNQKDRNDDDRDEYLIGFLDGYSGCNNIMSNVASSLNEYNCTIEEYIPAIMLAYHAQVSFNGRMYNGYLPAIGQLLFISNNIKKVNSALFDMGNANETFKIFTHTVGYFQQTEIDSLWGIGGVRQNMVIIVLGVGTLMSLIIQSRHIIQERFCLYLHYNEI